MELGSHHMAVWEKLKFQLPDCFRNSSRRMRSRNIVAQKKPLVSKPMRFVRIAVFSFDFSRSFNAFSPQKKRSQLAVLQRCNSKAVPPF
jgi:hypothetical protein